MIFLCATIAASLIYFFGFYYWRNRSPVLEPRTILGWLYVSWNYENQYWKYAWVTLLAVMVCVAVGLRRWKCEPVRSGWLGLLWIFAGLLLWVAGDRSGEIRFSVMSLPFLILGSVHFVAGWRSARHLIFPLSLFFFLIPFPWLQRLTNEFRLPLLHHQAWIYEALGGGDSHEFIFGCLTVPFPFLIPVFVAALIAAKYCCHSPAARVLIIGFSLPVAFYTEALRGAVQAWLYWKQFDWYTKCRFRDETDLLLVLALSALFSFLVIRLVERTQRRKQKKTPGRAEPLPQ